MNHRAAAAFDHLRDQKTIKADGRQEVEVQFGQPVVVCKGSEASAWCRRSTKNMSQDVDAAKALKGGLGQGCCPLGRLQVCPDELDAVDGLWCSTG